MYVYKIMYELANVLAPSGEMERQIIISDAFTSRRYLSPLTFILPYILNRPMRCGEVPADPHRLLVGLLIRRL